MATADRQLAFTTGPVPSSVQVSGPDRITPKTVNASFDGTGAAGDFMPCLIITGRTGHEVARIPAPKVAAGASAEVSWFPRVAGVASAANLSWASAHMALNQAVPAGLSTGGYFDLVTNDPAAFSLTGGGFPRFEVDKAGTYVFLFGFNGSAPLGGPVANPWTTILAGGPSNNLGLLPFSFMGSRNAIGAAGSVWGTMFANLVVMDATNVGGSYNWFWNNLTGVTLQVVFASVFAIRIAD